MRVCHLCDGSVAGDYFRNITAGLTAAGIELLLVELGSGTAPSWLADFPGVKYRSLDAMGSRKIFSARKKVAELVRSEKIDILHTHLFYSGLAAALGKKQLGTTTFAMMRHHTGVVRMLGSPFHVRADNGVLRFQAMRINFGGPPRLVPFHLIPLDSLISEGM